MRHRNSKKQAFTIVELLTVMGVIALLISILVPALNAVKRIATDTKQRAQFNAIKAGLEMFRNDVGDYPESTALDGSGGIGVNATTPVITGAQRLAEALLGRDLQGFDLASRWHQTLDAAGTPSNAYGGNPVVAAELTKSLERRKGPYLDLEGVGAYNIDQLYCVGSTATSSPSTIYGTTDPDPALNDPAPFITDVYTDKTVTITYTVGAVTSSKSVRAGTPVLYFKAIPSNKDLRRPALSAAPKFRDCTYDYYDNFQLLELGKMSAWTTAGAPGVGTPNFHPMANNASNYEKFYETLTNHQIPNLQAVSYRPDTYILMSAGRDGLFGTADDIYNFGEKTQ